MVTSSKKKLQSFHGANKKVCFMCRVNRGARSWTGMKTGSRQTPIKIEGHQKCPRAHDFVLETV